MANVFFTRIPKDIIHSSVWFEPLEVRVLWITLLAMKGPDQIVHKSMAMIAAAAHLDVAVAESAMKKLMEPDPNSSNRRYEGRRVKELPEGGFLLLNGDYWDKQMMKEYNREAQAESRMKKKGPGSVEQITTREAAKGNPKFT